LEVLLWDIDADAGVNLYVELDVEMDLGVDLETDLEVKASGGLYYYLLDLAEEAAGAYSNHSIFRYLMVLSITLIPKLAAL
jgi:hypothetical protein